MKRTAGFIVFTLNKRGLQVLLVKERKTRTWSLPKGKVGLNETILSAALRETREETGLVVKPSLRLRSIRVPEQNKRLHFFAARLERKVRTVPVTSDVVKAKFVPFSKALKMLSTYQRHFLLELQKAYSDNSNHAA